MYMPTFYNPYGHGVMQGLNAAGMQLQTVNRGIPNPQNLPPVQYAANAPNPNVQMPQVQMPQDMNQQAGMLAQNQQMSPQSLISMMQGLNSPYLKYLTQSAQGG